MHGSSVVSLYRRPCASVCRHPSVSSAYPPAGLWVPTPDPRVVKARLQTAVQRYRARSLMFCIFDVVVCLHMLASL